MNHKRNNKTVSVFVTGQQLPIVSKRFNTLEDAKAFESYVENNYIEFLKSL